MYDHDDNDSNDLTSETIQNGLHNLLESIPDMAEDEDDDDDAFALADIARGMAECLPGLVKVATFADRGVLTRDEGLVLTFADGSEFQLTIVQSR